MDTDNQIYTLSFVSIILFYMLKDVNLLISTIAITISTGVMVYNFIVSLKERRRKKRDQQVLLEKNRQEQLLVTRQLQALEAKRAEEEAINKKELELLNLQIEKLKNNQ